MHHKRSGPKSMIIHLKKNEKLFLNGAVIRLDRRGSIELLNDAQFLLASHIMQVEDATTPLKRLYFIVQTMLIDPTNSELTRSLFVTHVNQICLVVDKLDYRNLLTQVKQLVDGAEFFEALKLLRKHFSLDTDMMRAVSSTDKQNGTTSMDSKAA